jgi:hypothetical protein
VRETMPVHPGCVKRHPDLPKSVPMLLLAPYEKQAQTNHAQSLDRLAERGGLDWIEMDWIIRGVRWGTEDQHTVAHERRAAERVLAKLAESSATTNVSEETGMALNLNEITHRLNHWLAKNDLPREGVKISIEFPDKDTACRAEACIKREIEPMMAFVVTGGTFGAIETMNGLGLSITCRKS